jgi:hypothetical protein
MYLIPLVRTCRAIAACTILPNDPLFAITISEITSYTIPFINNSPLNAINNMFLFLFYFYNYNDSAIDIMDQFKNKYIFNYKLESIIIFIYLFFYFVNFHTN